MTDSPPGTEVVGKGRNIFPFSFQIPDRYVFFFFPLDFLVPSTYVFCCSPQENPIDLYGLHRKSCSQAESGAKTVDEADKKGQNSLYICLQTIHGDSGIDGEELGLISPISSRLVACGR